MRSALAVLVVFGGLFVPKLGNAQVLLLPAPPPNAPAAQASSWVASGDPLYYAGSYYYPTGPTVFFDGNVMRRAGSYEGVAFYVDTTQTPYSIVYVPIGNNILRPFERRRMGELAGTTGSRAPSFPVQRDVELSATNGAAGYQPPPLAPIAQPEFSPLAAQAQPAAGTFSASGTFSLATPMTGAPSAIESRHIVSIPPPTSNAGIWIEFEGARWHSAGRAVAFTPERFTRVGDYHGVPVYRAVGGSSNEIYMPAMSGGPLAPFRR